MQVELIKVSIRLDGQGKDLYSLTIQIIGLNKKYFYLERFPVNYILIKIRI